MKTRILTTITAATLVMTTMLPTLAAHAATNPLQKLEQAGKKVLTNAEQQAKGLLSRVTTAGDPTAVQVAQGLLSVYAHQQVWPKGLQTPGSPGQKTNIAADWVNGATPVLNRSLWVGLSTVFPGQPASQYAKLLGMSSVPQDQPITAGTLAQWLLNWQLTARIPKDEQFEMKFQPTQNPYTLMSDYSFFYGTDFKNANTPVSAHDLAMVEKNIVDVDQCYRVVASNKIELLRPMAMVWGYGKNASIIPQAQALQEFDHTILIFGKNQVTVDPTIVLSPFSVSAMYFKSVNSGIDGASTYFIFKKNDQKVTANAFLTPKTTSHFQPSEVRTDSTGLLLPSSIGFNRPFLMFGLYGAGFSAPAYYFTFSNGKLNGINVYGYADNSWPIYESSNYN